MAVPQPRQDLVEFFAPDGVAIVGQVNRTATRAQLDAAYTSRYHTRWYLVNPKGGEVDGIPVYTTLAEVPDPVSMVVISTPPSTVAAIIDEAGAIGARFALVFSSGFAEIGPDGAAHERAVAEAGRRTGIRIFGPNTNTNAFETIEPEVTRLRGGRIGVVTQSGHNGRPVVQGAFYNIGFSRQIPCGNEVDLDVTDFIEYFAHDDDTAVVAGYIEGFKDPDKLRRALDACNSQRKPVVLLKMGSTAAGSRMASSHTGHLTGSDQIVNGLFSQYGVTRVRDIDELIETSALFAKLPAGTGPGAALYSISGGSGTLMAEICEAAGVPIPRLTDTTIERLYELIPRYLTVANPIDNGGTFITSQPPEVRQKAIHIVADDPNVDVIVIGITGAIGGMTDKMADDLLVLADSCPKPIVVTWNSPKTFGDGFEEIVSTGLPMFRSFRGCFNALRAFNDYQAAVPSFRPRKAARARLSAAARGALGSAVPGSVLGADASRVLLSEAGVPLAREAVVTSAAAAARTASEYGFPVVMKIASADFPHKSDAGLVRLGVDSPAAVRTAYAELVARARAVDPSARVDGVLVQEMVTDGVECIIGVTRDPALGPAVMVGLGGIFAEILKDTAVRPIPFDRRDAETMVRSLQGFPLLNGARGRPKADVKALVDAVMAVQRLTVAAGDDLAELDLNPILVRTKGAVAVDTLVVRGG
jgi:acetate---CoA ligase (ADP-forming)